MSETSRIEEKMRILVVNDDGYSCEGIRRLAAFAQSLGLPW